MNIDQQAFYGARRRSELIGNFKEPFNVFCSELLWNTDVSGEDHKRFHLSKNKYLNNLSDVDLDGKIEQAMINLANLLTEAQRREIETIKSYYNETTSKD